ncbi:MAG: hypothetical protein M1828_004803 [Chrysothrix sp. TS-e1954]|nr:MAG: hypothetical protein M1828_004803 [Chrysothrix sp. TS-e1954]
MLASNHPFGATLQFTQTDAELSIDSDEEFSWLNTETRNALATLRQSIASLWETKPQCHGALILVRQTISLLDATQNDILRANDEWRISKIILTLHAIFIQAVTVDVPAYHSTLTLVFFAFGLRIRGLEESPNHRVAGISRSKSQAHREYIQLLDSLGQVGLAGPYAQKAFAYAADRILTELIAQKFGSNVKRASIIDQLKQRVARDFSTDVVCFFGDNDSSVAPPYPYRTLGGQAPITLTSDYYVARAVQKLGELRTSNLYTTIETLDCPPLQCGALLDMIHYLATPSARSIVSDAFTSHLRSKLLHQARSTVSILDVYVRIIAVFKAIDPSGIVLFRVVEPIKAFLRNRDDAVRIVLSSLLDGSVDDLGQPKPSSEMFSAPVARCMDDEDQGGMSGEWHEAMDYQNLDWQPEPIDAAVGHQAVRNLSTMTHLVTLSPADAFIKELQNVLCERLLQQPLNKHSNDQDAPPATPQGSQRVSHSFDREIRLLNLFTLRFSEYHIQSLEVMLQDVLSSQKLNARFQEPGLLTPPGLRNFPGRQSKQQSSEDDFSFAATLISLSYWPSSLASHTSSSLSTKPTTPFTIPYQITLAYKMFENKYRALKRHRKLEWLHTLGNATVKLELSDRTLNVTCATWQAIVIDAISTLSNLAQDDAGKDISTSSIADETRMEEDLVASACTFWVFQRVLTPHATKPSTYTILETLTASQNDLPPPPPASQPLTQIPASDPLKDNAPIYSQFIIGMLTNQGAMSEGRILTMLKMAVPGGFPFGQRELVESVLGPLTTEGRVSREGGSWRVVR